MDWWIAYLLMGLLVGFFAGMLGIGGGTMLGPIMVFIFTAQHFTDDRVLHLALGTALTSIAFTSLSSIRAHHKHRAVRWDIVRNASPGLVAGTLLGTFVTVPAGARAAQNMPVSMLKRIFAVILFILASRMLWSLYYG